MEKKDEILYKELSYKLVGFGIKIHTQLGFGFLEKVYENAMMVLLKKEGIPAKQQVPLRFISKGNKSEIITQI
jgi:GxxExxY protein